MTENPKTQQSHPDIIAPPLPRLPLGARLLGLPLLAAGLGLGGWFIWTMRRAGTPVDPYEAPTALVADGPFRLTRNPAYVGLTLTYAGLSLLVGTLWSLLLLPGVLLAVDRGVIQGEERYLEKEFGSSYSQYRRRVRRWL
jgi:protein-S-isoprenylcysteine O-methyltransferase Ste14